MTNMLYLWFKISVNITQSMKLIHSSEHFTYVEPCVLFLEYTRVVQKRTEVTTRNVFHSEIYMRGILESV